MTRTMAGASGPRPAVPHSPRSDLAPSRERPAAARYGVAALAVAAALALGLALSPWLGGSVFFPLLGAVAVAAWYGGLRPGLLATAQAMLAATLVWIPPAGRLLPIGVDDAVKLALFAALGVGLSFLAEALIGARRAAEAARDEAERLLEQLQDQAVELEQQTEEGQSLNAELEDQIEAGDALRLELEAANDQLRAAGAEAQAARARTERILETMAEGVVLIGADGRITYANTAAGRILRLRPDEARGLRYDDPRFAPPHAGGAPLPPSDAPITRALRTGETVHGVEVEFPGGDDGARVLRVSAAPLRGADGAPAGVVVSFDDVTADRRAEEALRESEARFRAMADTAPVLIWMAGTDALYCWFNRPWLSFTGRTLEEESGNGWTDGVHPDDYPRCLTTYLSSFEARRSFQMEYRLRRHDGAYRWLLDNGVPRFTPDGAFAGYIGSCVDVTEMREAAEQQRFLAEAGTLLAASLNLDETLARVGRLAVPALADFCVVDVLDDGGQVRRAAAHHADREMAPLMAELRRFAPRLDAAHPVSEALRAGVAQASDDVTAAQLDALASGPEHRALLARLGVTAHLVVPLVASGRVLGSILLCATTSGRRFGPAERVRAEELARRAALAVDNARLYERSVEANRAKSDFLAVMSHELRTPLNAILGYTDLFLAGIPAPLPDAVVPQMGRVQAAGRHLLELIEEVLTFARLEAGQEEARAEPTTAGALGHDAAALVEPLALERGIGFVVRLPDPDVPMETDARKVRQILVNLLGNGIKFTERGQVSLDVRPSGEDVLFVVSDTGIGIAPEHLGRIFEPFWQVDQGLMRAHGGSGLGLAVARQLARLLGGDVTAESRPGAGSVFTVRLPRKLGGA